MTGSMDRRAGFLVLAVLVVLVTAALPAYADYPPTVNPKKPTHERVPPPTTTPRPASQFKSLSVPTPLPTPQSEGLPTTGAMILREVAVGLSLLTIGGTVLVLARRRRFGT
jgi:hypothetical protein